MTEKVAYILRGAPASGKGTLSKLLLPYLNGKVATLELDTFRWDFHLAPREITAVTVEEHSFAYENFLIMLDRYCQKGDYQLLIEGLFAWATPGPHGNMRDILGCLKQHGFKTFPLLLSAPKAVLWKRNLTRDYSVPAKEFDDLYQNVMNKVGEQEIHIDVGACTLNESLEKIRVSIGI